MRAPQRVAALILQKGDIYQDAMGPKYAAIKRYWDDPSPKNQAVQEEAVSERGFSRRADRRDRRASRGAHAARFVGKSHWPLMNTPIRPSHLGAVDGSDQS